MSERKIIFIAAGIFLGIIIAGVFIFFVPIRRGATRNADRVLYTGNEARQAIESFLDTTLPPVADNFFYREEGFMDSGIHIGMDIDAGTAWPFIQKYSGINQADFKPFEEHVSPAGTFLPPEDTEYWNYQSMAAPKYAEIIIDDSYEIIIYDEKSGRLLIHFSSN